MIRRFLALVIFFSFSQLAHAQNDCGETLNIAQDAFDKGHIEKISSLLFDCLNNFTKEQKIEAYRLLTITYLYLDDPFGAESSFLALLKEDPEFRVSTNDPVELEYLSRQYITTPIISFSAKLGANFSTITVLQSNRMDSQDYPPSKYKLGVGLNVGGAMEVHFNKVVGLNIEVDISSRSYDKEGTLFGTQERQELEQNRTNWHGSLPVFLKFTYPGEKLYPYIYGGYSPSFTISSKATYIRTPEREAKLEGSGININNKTPGFSHSLIFGVGLKRRIGYRYVLVDLRYRLGMTNMNKQEEQFNLSNPGTNDTWLTYAFPDDDFRWNGIELTVGYVWPKYKPRAKNSVTLQTVVKNMFSKKGNSDE